MNDVLSIAQSGMQSAGVRLRNSAHNVANLATPDFKNHRTDQVSLSGGGSRATTSVDREPQDVSIAHEAVEQIRAKVQFKASARVVGIQEDMRGSLLDAFA